MVRPNLPLGSAEPPNLTPNLILGNYSSLLCDMRTCMPGQGQGQFCLHNCSLNPISIFVNIFLQDFHANNGSFLIRAGTSNSHSISSTASMELFLRFAVHERELPQLISVNAVNDLESRMQNEIAVILIELDQLQQNWICRV